MPQTLSFLFTDIEGSTPLWDRQPAAMRHATIRHNALLREAIGAHGGSAFRIVGDAFCVAFPEATAAVSAAIAAQRALRGERWNDAPIHVRMGLHSGAVEPTDDEIFRGPSLARAARVMTAAHGDQILATASIVALLEGWLPPGSALLDLGDHTLRGFVRPERIYQFVVPGLRADFPPIHTAEAQRSNLPQTLTSFVGRAQAVSEIADTARRARMVTLIGSGGTGKTRLALKAAKVLLGTFQDGVWLVELGPLADAGLVAQAIAGVLGARAEGDVPTLSVVEAALRGKRLVLVLDNCEHVVDEVAAIASKLLQGLPDLHLIATSREALGVAGEVVYRVSSMTIPRTEPGTTGVMASEAGALFLERARAVAPGFALTDRNAEAVARVCRRLDGIPLAIELAAARLAALSIDELARRVDDRFRLLTGGLRTALPRHRTLRALVDWSYDLLSPDERVVLAALAVFAGGFSLASAEQVCRTDVLRDTCIVDAIAHLVSKSLVVVDQSQESETRYRLLETIRQYAAEKLAESGQADAVRQRHLVHFVDFAERAADGLGGPLALEWLDRLECDHDNLRAALDWSAESAPATQAKLAGTLVEFWEIRGYFVEGWERLERAITAHTTHDDARLAALLGAGRLAFRLDYTQRCREIFDDAIALARELGNASLEADVIYFNVASLALAGDAIEPLASRVSAIAQSTGDARCRARALILLGQAALFRGDTIDARMSFSHAAALFDDIGCVLQAPLALFLAGGCAFEQLDFAASRRFLEDALIRQRRLGYVHDVAQTLRSLAKVGLNEHRLDEASALCTESLRIFESLHDRNCAANSAMAHAMVLYAQGDLAAALARVGPAVVTLREIRSSSLLVSALGLNARVHMALGDERTARQVLSEGLAVQRGTYDDRRLPSLLESVARLAPDAAAAPVLLGCAAVLRESLNTTVFPTERADFETAYSDVRARHPETDFDCAYAAGKALSRDAGIDTALSLLKAQVAEEQ
jgi:predicted ATPase/class 3 adenylate cyclase